MASGFIKTERFLPLINNKLFIALFFVSLSLSALCPTKHYLKHHSSLDRHPDLKEQVEKNKKIIDQIIQVEEEHSKNHYVLYHAQSNIRFYQDLILELEKKRNPSIAKNFLPLRSLQGDFYNSKDHFFNSIDHLVNDHNKEISYHLLSVNLNLFANETQRDSCSLGYWLLDEVHHPKINRESILDEIMAHYQVDHKYKKELQDISNSIKDQTLLQILIPKEYKEQLNSHFYFAHDKGEICHHLNQFPPSEVFEKYTSLESKNLPHVDQLQGRLVLNKNFILNPDIQIFFKRYSINVEEGAIDEYQKKLHNFIQRKMD